MLSPGEEMVYVLLLLVLLNYDLRLWLLNVLAHVDDHRVSRIYIVCSGLLLDELATVPCHLILLDHTFASLEHLSHFHGVISLS